MTHDQDIPFLLPGLAPTHKTVEAPTVVIVKFRGDLMESERLIDSLYSNFPISTLLLWQSSEYAKGRRANPKAGQGA